MSRDLAGSTPHSALERPTGRRARNHILASPAAATLFESGCPPRSLRLTAGQVLCEPGDQLPYVYFPEDCLVTLSTPMSSGREVASTLRGCDDAIGYVEALGSGRAFSRAVVRFGGEAVCVPAGRYREAYERSAPLRELINRRIEALLAEARQSIACQAFHAAPERLSRLLLECFHRTGMRRLALTHDLIGDLTGLGRTTISQTATELKKKGLLDHCRGSIELLDVGRLEAAACECYHVLRDARAAVHHRARIHHLNSPADFGPEPRP